MNNSLITIRRGLATFFLLFFAICVLAGEQYVVTASSLNVRKSPDKNAPVLATLEKGKTVNVLSIDGDWARIPAGSADGYVAVQFIEPVSDIVQPDAPVKSGHSSFPLWSMLILALAANFFARQEKYWISSIVTVGLVVWIYYYLSTESSPLWFLTEVGVGFGWMLLNMLIFMVFVAFVWGDITVLLSFFGLDSISIKAAKFLFAFFVFVPDTNIIFLFVPLLVIWSAFVNFRHRDAAGFYISLLGIALCALIVHFGSTICADKFYGIDTLLLIVGLFPSLLSVFETDSTAVSSKNEGLKVYEITDEYGRRHTLTQSSKYSECHYIDEDGNSWYYDGSFRRG